MAESNQYSESPSISKVVPAPLEKKITSVPKICGRVEQIPNDFYAEEIYHFAIFVSIVLTFLGLTQSKII